MISNHSLKHWETHGLYLRSEFSSWLFISALEQGDGSVLSSSFSDWCDGKLSMQSSKSEGAVGLLKTLLS